MEFAASKIPVNIEDEMKRSYMRVDENGEEVGASALTTFELKE